MLEQDIVRRALVQSAARDRALSESLGRVFDFTVALAAIVFLGPVMMITALLIACERKGPIIFRHQRIGKEGRSFIVYKFRTMSVQGEEILARHLENNRLARAEWEADHKLKADPRVSRLGSFLRSSSLDELPQFINVLLGQMSIVGPRPITLAEISKYGDHFGSYCSVKPGVTGVWQVSGRNNISYQRRVEMDALYARRKSVMLDLTLVMATIPAVLMRRGSY